jgi:AraC-like DNA-binding protein
MLGIEQGIDPSALLDGTGLTRARLEDRSGEITAGEELRLIENLVGRSADPAIGLQAGSRSTVRVFGMLGFACASATTLRESLEISLRYQDLAFTVTRSSLIFEREATFLAIDVSHLPEAVHRFAVDHVIATIWVVWHEMGERLRSPRIELARPAPPDVDSYRHLFGVAPMFNRPADRLAIANADLDCVRGPVDATTLRLCEEQCGKLLAERRARLGAAGLVRERLSHATGMMPSMAMVASDLQVSPRHLRRALTQEGTSFRRLNEEVRLAKAQELLARGTQVQQVAEALGYASSSSFVHAFKRWTPTTPGRHKAGISTGERD